MNITTSELHAGWNAELGMFLTEVEYHEELTFDGDIPAHGDASILFSFVGDPLKRIIRGYAQWPTEIKKGKAWAEVNENVWLDVGAGLNSHVQPTDEPTVLLRGTQTPSSSESIVRVVRGPNDSPSRDYEVCVDGIDAIWTLSCYPDMPRYPVGIHLKISGDPEIWKPQPVEGRDWATLLKGHPQFAAKCDWTRFTGRDWSIILDACPQFVEMLGRANLTKYDWETLNAADSFVEWMLCKLGNRRLRNGTDCMKGARK